MDGIKRSEVKSREEELPSCGISRRASMHFLQCALVPLGVATWSVISQIEKQQPLLPSFAIGSPAPELPNRKDSLCVKHANSIEHPFYCYGIRM